MVMKEFMATKTVARKTRNDSDQRCIDCDQKIDLATTCQLLPDNKARCVECVEKNKQKNEVR